MDKNTELRKTFTDYLTILFKWRKFLFINLLVITIVATGISFLISEKYKAVTSIMINEASNSNPLNALANSAVGSLLGGSLFGGSTSTIDKMFGYLESRTILVQVIDKFDLVDYYGITKYKLDKTLKALRDDVSFDLTTNGFLEISVVNEDPQKAADIANFFVERLDSLNRKYSITFAKSYRKFVEKRYFKNLKDLQRAEEEFEKFQEKYKIYAIPEQIEIAFQAIGKLESDLVLKQLTADLIKETQGGESPNYKQAEKQVQLFQEKLNNALKGKHTSDESIVFIDLSKLPRLQKEFLEIKREIEVQAKLLEFTLPMYEQAMMEEQKNLPVVVVLDKAVPPELKYSPKKAFIILSVFFLSFFIFLLIVTRGATLINYQSLGKELNLIQLKEYKFYMSIVRLYKIKY